MPLYPSTVLLSPPVAQIGNVDITGYVYSSTLFLTGTVIGQIASNVTSTVAGLTPSVFAVAQQSVAWNFGVDTSGNVGARGAYYSAVAGLLLTTSAATAGCGFYHDSTNMALRTNGAIYLQGAGGSSATPSIYGVGNIVLNGGVLFMNAAQTAYLQWNGTNFFFNSSSIQFSTTVLGINGGSVAGVGSSAFYVYVPSIPKQQCAMDTSGNLGLAGCLYVAGAYVYGNGNLVLNANGAGAVLVNYGGSGSSMNVYNGTTSGWGTINCGPLSTQGNSLACGALTASGSVMAGSGWTAPAAGDMGCARSSTAGVVFFGAGGVSLNFSVTVGSVFAFHGTSGYIPVYGGAYTNASDVRFKTDVVHTVHGLRTIKQLQPRDFRWIESKRCDHGFIAQEVQSVLPDLITADNDGFLGLNYSGLIPVLVKAVQEQQAMIDELRAKVFCVKE